MKIKAINPFDLIIIIVLILVLAPLPFYTKLKRNVQTKKTELTIKTQGEGISEAVKISDRIYVNSVNKPVIISRVEKISQGGTVYLLITVVGDGFIEKDREIFNGQRLLIGQKAELHGRFWAQGNIVDIKYAD